MGKNHSKKKPKTEFQVRRSRMAKLDHQLKLEEERRKKEEAKLR